MAENMREQGTTELQLKSKADELVSQANALEIVDAETLNIASRFYIACKAIEKRITEYWKPTKDAARKAWKSICDKEAAMLNIPRQANDIAQRKIRMYRDEQRRIAEEEQRKADEARRKEEERIRSREMKKAERALDKGDEQKAEEHLEKADEAFVPPVDVKPDINKTERTDIGSLQTVFETKVEAVSIREICAAVAAGKLPDHIISVKIGPAQTWAKGNGLKSGIYYGLKVSVEESYRAVGTKVKE